MTFLETSDSDRGRLNGQVFTYLVKAFVNINHEIILKKLSKYNVDRDALKWFKSYPIILIQKCIVGNHPYLP